MGCLQKKMEEERKKEKMKEKQGKRKGSGAEDWEKGREFGEGESA